MKRYRVEITRSAENEIGQAFAYAASRAPLAAERWYNRLMKDLEALEVVPNGYPLAPESKFVPERVRQLRFGRKPNYWRVLFIVRRATVYVIHFRRGARQRMDAEDLRIPDQTDD